MDPTTQVILSIGVPTVAVMLGILINNSRLSDFRSHVDTRFDLMQKYLDARFGEANAELRRVEEVMDARLKHLEERAK